VREDIQALKSTAEERDKLNTENEILKSKIQDLETRVNTLSRARDEESMASSMQLMNVQDRNRFEKMIQILQDENRLIIDKYRIAQQSMMKADEEIIKIKALCQAKDQEILKLQSNWK
jgi:hypothetical protein